MRPECRDVYPGALNESQAATAQASVDATIQSLITELPKRPQRSTVLGTMKIALANFDISESEERDQILSYLGRVMDVCGVHSSGELFNDWLI
ncbi:DUF4844 domain-containing protein [Duganella dendranthematis]|uniref:DUF4844 domain-containing protein n=1 Tax=Duganella dendranthematis TaxID=2728021 RepID=UPI0018EE829C|nr:DUF4844 domain-containing protein [Duganella dendranthematis]